MFQISKNYATWLQYRLKYETVRTEMVYIFIVFYSLFSLHSLHFFFSLLSHWSLSLLLVLVIISTLVFQDLRLIRDVHRQQLRHSSNDDNALRRQGLGGQLLGNAQTRSGLFAELTGSLSLTSIPLTDSFQSFSPSKAATADLA